MCKQRKAPRQRTAAFLLLRIANERRLLTWSLQAGSRGLQSRLYWQQASIQQDSGSANSRRRCLINTTPTHILFTACQCGLQPRSRYGDAWGIDQGENILNTFWFRSQFWLSLAALHLLCHFKSCIFVRTGRITLLEETSSFHDYIRKSTQFQTHLRLDVKDRRKYHT